MCERTYSTSSVKWEKWRWVVRSSSTWTRGRRFQSSTSPQSSCCPTPCRTAGGRWTGGGQTVLRWRESSTVNLFFELPLCFLTNLRCEWEYGVSDDVEFGGSQDSDSPVGSSCQTEPRVATCSRTGKVSKGWVKSWTVDVKLLALESLSWTCLDSTVQNLSISWKWHIPSLA